MILRILAYFLFFHFSLLVPGFTVARKLKFFPKRSGLELILAYVVSIVSLGLLSTAGYLLKVNSTILFIVGWIAILCGSGLFCKQKLYHDLVTFKFPLICLVVTSVFSSAFLGLRYSANYSFIPDPKPVAGSHYGALNVKVLNVSRTGANDNYIPYRQAQFFINRSNPATDSFIDEWGVTFFQRTPLMGSVAAGYFVLLKDKLPIGYTWSPNSTDLEHTYLKFQILAHILNALFIIPAAYLLKKLLDKKTAVVTSLFLITSPYFLYNAIFSWPKSLVAFFILTIWLLILENKFRYTIVAGIFAGIAYLTHDLAILYIASVAFLLLYQRRFRETAVFAGLSAAMALPWMFTSSVLYKKTSSFFLYPLSLYGLPQGGQTKEIIREFFDTSPLRIISIRLDTLFYLLSPYDLIYSGGGQSIANRLWAVGLFSIPGSVGAGLILPAILGITKLFRRLDLWIMVAAPILLTVAIVGFPSPRAIASLHFAQATIVILSGIGVSYLIKRKRKRWLYLVLLLHTIQLIYFALVSFAFREEDWLSTPASAVSLLVILATISGTAYYLFRVSRAPTTQVNKLLN